MLQATTPVAVLITTWTLGIHPPNYKTLGNVSFIVLGVIIASIGEIKFVMIGFLFQVGGIIFEAIRLSMVERLLSSAEFKMDPLVSLYYYAPACAIMNGIVCMFTELPILTMDDIDRVGGFTLFANASIAFMLNVSVVFLVCLEFRTSKHHTLTVTRSARLLPSSLPCRACSRTFSSSLHLSSCSVTPLACCRLSVTASPWVASFTTSWAVRR